MPKKSRQVAYSQLNAKIKSFDWRYGKIGEILPRADKIHGYGCQIYEFFISFPFLIASLSIPFDSKCDVFNMYSNLRNIIKTIMWDQVNSSQLIDLRDSIICFINQFKKVFLKETITIKMHNLVHYLRYLGFYGGLMRYSSLRFERVHQTLKRSFINNRNFKNVPFFL